MKDTVSFQRQIYAKVLPDIIEFDSNDPKADMLKKKSGVDIFGLNEPNKETIRNISQEELINRVKAQLHL